MVLYLRRPNGVVSFLGHVLSILNPIHANKLVVGYLAVETGLPFHHQMIYITPFQKVVAGLVI